MVRERAGERLDAWLSRVEEQGGPQRQSFANGLRKDSDAVKAGLPLQWSQGQVEGQVHRLTRLTRQMDGRGHFDLPRKRVLKRAEKKHPKRAYPCFINRSGEPHADESVSFSHAAFAVKVRVMTTLFCAMAMFARFGGWIPKSVM